MLGLWIALGALAALAFLVCCLRVGVRAAFGPAGISAQIRVGPLHLRLTPRPEGKKEPAKKERPKAKPAEKTEKKPAKKFPRPTASDLRDAWRTLAPPAHRALWRIRRGIRISPLRLSVTVGGAEDPADAAELCGLLNAAVWTLMPPLERLADVPEPCIHTGIDFDATETLWEGELGVTLRLGTLLAVAFTLGLPALQWLNTYQKRHKPRQAAGQAAAKRSAA